MVCFTDRNRIVGRASLNTALLAARRFKYENGAIPDQTTMAKKICISREAHERLKDLRREGETFTEAILRVSDERREK